MFHNVSLGCSKFDNQLATPTMYTMQANQMTCFIGFILLTAYYGRRVATLVPYLASGMGSNIGLEHTLWVHFLFILASHTYGGHGNNTICLWPNSLSCEALSDLMEHHSSSETFSWWVLTTTSDLFFVQSAPWLGSSLLGGSTWRHETAAYPPHAILFIST